MSQAETRQTLCRRPLTAPPSAPSPGRSDDCGIRVDAAIHRIAWGKSEKVTNAELRPAGVTAKRESQVASAMERLKCARRVRW